MIILNADAVRAALPMSQTVEAMKQAYAALSGGKAEVPLRTRLEIPPHEGVTLVMPAYLHTTQTEALAVKTVSVFPGNPVRGLPLIHAAVLAMEPDTGRPLALLEGGALTAIRTGAASGAATDILARPDAKTVAIFGAGVQGRTQLEAVCTVREIETAWIFDLDRERAQSFVDDLAGQGHIPADLRVAADPAEAASLADIICTATTSKVPVYPAEAIRPGTHINGVGSYTPEMLENPPEIYSRACAFSDARDAVLAEAGEVIAAVKRKWARAAQWK
jgi:ornithine cyclodeaminase/alanine dehydrogenase-like protein (mu-crystallin family)